jgi:hypothetical protein
VNVAVPTNALPASGRSIELIICAQNKGTSMNRFRLSFATLSVTVALLGAGTVAVAGQTIPAEDPKMKKQPPARIVVKVEAVPRSKAPVSKPVSTMQPIVRRPDLELLPLSHENTNKPLPYVDVMQSGSGQEKPKEPLVKSKNGKG